MTCLTPLADALARVLDTVRPVPARALPLAQAQGAVLAQDLAFPADLPPTAQALRAGFAVAALDTVGASPFAPVPLGAPPRVLPGDPMPAGTDAVLLVADTDGTAPLVECLRPVDPGTGLRRAGHDARAGDLIAAQGHRLDARHMALARAAGLEMGPVRQPRVALIDLPEPMTAFLTPWLIGLGADLVDTGAADLTLRPATDPTPRLALAPGDAAEVAVTDTGVTLGLPARFDAGLAAVLALGLPVLAALSGAVQRTRTLPLSRKLSSGLGVSDLVLLTETQGTWSPGPAGTLTLADLARADAFALIPPQSEGLPQGAPLAATPILSPFA